MVNSADSDWFLCYWGYLLLWVMVVGYKKTCLAQPQGSEMFPVSFQDTGHQHTVRLSS